MTTVMRTRLPLQVLSMSANQERRKSKRIAALYDEADGDFQFSRPSKRSRTTTTQPVEDEASTPSPAPAPAPKKSARGRPAKNAAPRQVTIPEETTTTRRKSTRRKPSLDAVDDASPLVVPKKATRRSTRRTSVEDEPAKTNGARGAETEAVADEDQMDLVGAATPQHQATSVGVDLGEAEKVALPISDTPVINRNKEMRKKGNGKRRSSLGTRGRRASSLIDMGHTALPHKEVATGEFYKHIECEGLPEPRRMKQLLTWCGERALSEKPQHGSANSGAVLGARAIQDLLLKDFQSKLELSNWFGREESEPVEVVKEPNPRNIEHEEKIKQLEEKIERLREQKKMWLSLKTVRHNREPLFPECTGDSSQQHLPDESLLDPAEANMLRSLTSKDSSFDAIRRRTDDRIRAIHTKLEFRIDSLADSVHKLEQRVATAGREAEAVLALSAARLKERDERDRRAAGTSNLPMQEVLRSLGRILPEGDG